MNKAEEQLMQMQIEHRKLLNALELEEQQHRVEAAKAERKREELVLYATKRAIDEMTLPKLKGFES